MAIMTNADRQAAVTDFTNDACSAREAIGVTKAELRAAGAAIDQWVSDNAASFNAALPAAARAGLTNSQKARLFMKVLARRFLSGV